MEVSWLPAMHSEGAAFGSGPVAIRDNILRDGWSFAPERAGLHVAWSGTMGEGLWEPHPRTWAAPGWGRLEAAIARAGPMFAAGGATLALRTHARHVLGDPHSALRFAQWLNASGGVGEAGGSVVMLADPIGWLTPGMIEAAEEHLERIFDGVLALRATGRLAGVVLTNLQATAAAGRDAIDDGAPMARGPVHAGAINADWIARGVRRLPPELMVFLEGGEEEAQRAWLGAAR